MATLNNGSEHKSEASSAGGSQHGQKKSRRRRNKGGKGSNHGDNKSDNGETPTSPPSGKASQEGDGSAKKKTGQKAKQTSRSKSPKGHGGIQRHKPKPPPEMTVIVNSVYLWDVVKKHADENAYQSQQDSYHQRHHLHGNHQQVAPYHFAPDVSSWSGEFATTVPDANSVNIVRASHDATACRQHVSRLMAEMV
jgi:hypothetical protein